MVALPGRDPEAEIEFEFLGITDLESPAGMHIHQHVFEFTENENRMTSVWLTSPVSTRGLSNASSSATDAIEDDRLSTSPA